MTHFSATSLSPNLMVSNVQATVDYYAKHFGFSLIQSVPAPEGGLIWAMMNLGPCIMMFQEAQSLSSEISALSGKEIGGTLNFYLKGKGVKELHDSLKAAGQRIVAPLNMSFYGNLEFSVQDLDGYVLTFAEEMG